MQAEKIANPEAAVLRLIADLRALLGDRHVLTDAGDMQPYLTEDRGLYQGHAHAVIRPGTTDEVAATVQACARHCIAMVPQGGNTGVVGGGVPEGAVVIALGRLNRIRDLDPLNGSITVEAGCILAHVQDAASSVGRLFPLSLGSEGSCQIGGNLATNAGGNAVLRYGTMRDLVLGLEVVLPDGEVLRDLFALRKNNTGYDLRHLFIGAEGTLGIITAAVLKLFPAPQSRASAFIACDGAGQALALYDRLRAAHGGDLTTFEFMERDPVQVVLDHAPGVQDPMAEVHPAYALIELTSPDPAADLTTALETVLAAGFEAGEVIDAVIAQNVAQAQALHAIRDTVSEAQKHAGFSVKHDVSVPVSRVADFIARASVACRDSLPGCRVLAFGHFGDGNIHFNITESPQVPRAALQAHYPVLNRIVHDIVTGMGGSISAEHGIGQLKRKELAHYKDPVALALMRRIKQALDPEGLMNPGKVL